MTFASVRNTIIPTFGTWTFCFRLRPRFLITGERKEIYKPLMFRTMSKTWVLFGLFLQLVIVAFLYNYFRQQTPAYGVRETTEVNWETIVLPKESLVDWRIVQRSKQLSTDIDWKKIPRKPAPASEDLHDKWIVVTSINSPTEDVKKLAAIEGWKVVVVGDTKTPADWRYNLNIES